MGTYRVCGDRSYRGHEPGDEFTEDLSPDEETRAIGRGSIEKVGATTTQAPAEPSVETAPQGGGLFGRTLADDDEEVNGG